MNLPDNLSGVIQISSIQLTSLLGDRDRRFYFAHDGVYVLDKNGRKTHFCPHAPTQDERTGTRINCNFYFNVGTPIVETDTIKRFVGVMTDSGS